ncbi:chromosome segregation protein SMC [Marinitenerispora sediminis]|uniref:Chromosome partition protein Smc n=1 Tax=Marinitenerispora sediminis TaxID=1931232 RepID=A0A368TBV8_9ACTN|nr:chromosome segregation protein SMC [Marinitenerispora sediminis]RCV54050.1 chromosome segregation protein SMC [Marinitenerispora sediminis]RCV60800.1 chromosome segregation protein SMC [Marinitenerispora sediminis]RCV62430.1 chromosome segregation protein SMC [Marinitenerispora sediminis]
MYLKNLTLRGFKSFASATTLRFEPGITCVVGPNGSGKSNVVDALAWVMGEQGAKSLRGGKMEDVIFAGTSSRAALGRAEVSLTIDNTDGALPIEYSEVTIKRTMFRNGGSEYAINGDTCRLLDIQDLLSDSGIGREMHVIVGQGQLDTVLHAGPEERRALIEEAAGILKHRKRKEKALRKLDAMQGNLNRVGDLTAELRRQLKPLGRQAEIARRAATIQAELRDARLRLLADDIVTLRERLEREEADEADVRRRRAAAERALADAQERETHLDTAAAEAAPLLARAQDAYHGLSRLSERLNGVAGLAAERHRNLSSEVEDERRGRDPEDLEREADEVRAQEEELQEQLDEARARLEEVVAERAATEAALEQEERRIAAAARAAADRREGLAKLRGRVDALRSRLAASEDEVERLREAAAEAAERAEAARVEHELAESDSADLDVGDAELDAAHEAARHDLAAVETRLNELRDTERAAERERAALAARKEALELGLNRKDGAGALLAAAERIPGLLGSVAALVQVEPGAEAAIAAALGAASDAVAVTGAAAADTALALLKKDDAGRAAVLVGAVDPADAPGGAAPPPAGARYALDAVTPPPELRDAVALLLADTLLVEDVAAARRAVGERPGVRAVTRDGDVVSAALVQGGSSSAPSLLEVQAAVDEAAERLEQAAEACEHAAVELAEAKAERARAATAVDEAAARRRAADRRRNEIAQQLGKLGGQARAAAAEAERSAAAVGKAAQGREADLQRLAELEDRLAQAEAEPVDDEDPDTGYRDELAESSAHARAAEMEARLAVRTAEERARSIAGRADSLLRAAANERQARERAARRRALRARQSQVARAVAEAAEEALRRIAVSLHTADAERRAAEEQRAARDAELKTVRARVRELSVELEKLLNVVHGSEVARAERKLRLEQLETRAVEEYGVEAAALVAEYGPRVPVPPPPDAGPDEAAVPFVRAVQEKRARTAERQLGQLGKINPLALEEFAALEERHAFLTAQLEDLKKTRRDLLTVVKEVDDRVQEVFASAYADVEREFAGIFGRLFPGGEGRLVLTEPDDMLATGVEVEARPPGKKVKRLSLLSGGERSLTAVAFLAAIFKARPSPFYVMDEVEAALDDTNLQRLLVIFEELRSTSQLIVITHQKRTMEAADALYGVTMQGDGISQVISQRLDRKAG